MTVIPATPLTCSCQFDDAGKRYDEDQRDDACGSSSANSTGLYTANVDACAPGLSRGATSGVQVSDKLTPTSAMGTGIQVMIPVRCVSQHRACRPWWCKLAAAASLTDAAAVLSDSRWPPQF